MEFTIMSSDDKPSAWKAITDLLDAHNELDGNWTEEDHKSVKRFLRGFTTLTMGNKKLEKHQIDTVNWLMHNEEEKIGDITPVEIELVEKWASKFE